MLGSWITILNLFLGLMKRELTVADYIVRRIARDRIDSVFGVTGGGVMYIVDAICRSPDVQLIPTHHEQFAGVAADSYARTHRPYGVALGTTGPGAAHLFPAISAAWQDSSPVLFLVGQVKCADSSRIQNIDIRQNGTFEMDTTRCFESVTKKVFILDDASRTPEILDKALTIMTADRPGPVVIELPLDIQAKLIKDIPTKPTLSQSFPVVHDPSIVDQLSSLLAKAKRPLVLLGIGTVRSGVARMITQKLDSASVPYVTTQFAKEAGSLEHSLFLGSPGVKANRCANLAIMESDLLIAIGSSLHQQVIGWDSNRFKQSPSFKVWFEVDKKTYDARKDLVDLSFNLDSRVAASLLTEALDLSREHSTNRDEWVERTRELREYFLLHYPRHTLVDGRFCLYKAVSALGKYSQRFASTVTDAGLVWYALAQHYFPSPGSHYISSGSFGSMGVALPMAIGSARSTLKPTLCVTGDGSAMMCISELATLTAQQLPVLLVINNNNGYVSIRSTHDRYFEGRHVGTDSSNGVFIPSYQSLAQIFGLKYFTAKSESQMEEVLELIFAQGISHPVLLEIYTYTDQAVEPLLVSTIASDGTIQSPSLDSMHPPCEI